MIDPNSEEERQRRNRIRDAVYAAVYARLFPTDRHLSDDKRHELSKQAHDIAGLAGASAMGHIRDDYGD